MRPPLDKEDVRPQSMKPVVLWSANSGVWLRNKSSAHHLAKDRTVLRRSSHGTTVLVQTCPFRCTIELAAPTCWGRVGKLWLSWTRGPLLQTAVRCPFVYLQLALF